MSSTAATIQNPLQFPSDIAQCHRMMHTLLETIRKYEQKIGRLEHSIDQLIRNRFGRKAERLEDIDPSLLLPFMQDYLSSFNTPPAAPETAPVEEPPKETVTTPRNQPKRRNTFPENLEREQVIHDLNEAEKACRGCGREMERIGQETTEQLDFIPAKLLVKEHIRYKYACKCKTCEGQIETAAKASQPIEKGLAASGLLAHVAISKYVDHQPLYRIEQIFKRHDIAISRSTMCGWMMALSELLTPLYELMKTEVLRSKVIKTDDTPVQVQDSTHPKGSRKGRVWIYCGDPSYPYYLYDFTPDRSRNGPETFLRTYLKGHLQADAYAGYDFIFADIARLVLELLCWAHARRKFFEAKKTAPQLSVTALAWIKELYAVERDIKDRPSAEKYAVRQERSVPLLHDFKAWLDSIPQEQALPQSPFRQAINYASNGWDALCRYTTDGDFDIDNNEAERQMRPIALGRKNWLFFGNDRGGQAATILMSVTQSAKRNGLNLYQYLKDVVETISDIPTSQLKTLLPDQWKQNHPATP